MVKAATREQYPSVHPEHPELTGPTIAMITGNPVSTHAHGRNTVVISTGAFDWENRPPGPVRSIAPPAGLAPARGWQC